MSSNNNNQPKRFDIDLSPIRDLGRQMDSFFNHSFKQMNSIFDLRPFWVDVDETDSNFIVTAELPGHSRDQIQVEVLGNHLHITVEESKKVEEVNEKQNVFHNRQSHQRKERMVNLPFEIPEEEMKASFSNGLLKITIPKKNSKRKFINIEDDD